MTETEDPKRAPASGRILRAGAIYFALVFGVGLALGPPRVLWLEPWLGKTIAVLLEAPLLIAAMWFGARWATNWARVDGGWVSYLLVGLLALLLQQIADLAVGFGFRGMTLAEQAAYFATPAGFVYLATLIAFALMPFIRMPRVER
ncbi:MAG: hypothetical protein A4S17_11145 [Proteobacteria bacterium HN_bin10]|nr:MAG: hypothetical protein A4S17_11145 [Proteobacteria bacterium HN_bin10]